jgi:hypothetical protein
MTTTENATLDCSAIIIAALLLFGPSLQRRVKGPAGHDGRLQHPSSSRFRFARQGGDTTITDLSGQSWQAAIDRAGELKQQDHDQHADHEDALERLGQRDGIE